MHFYNLNLWISTYCLGGLGGIFGCVTITIYPLTALKAIICTTPRMHVGPVSSLTRHLLSPCRLPQ